MNMEIKGKHNAALVFTDVIEDGAISQIRELCDQEFCEGSRIRIMPDVHAGAGCTIGTTMTITDKIVPNLVGVDIGCGMLTVQLKEKEIDFEALDRVIRERVPSGFATRNKPHDSVRYMLNQLETLKNWSRMNQARAVLSIGTLGGGNHFIECNRDGDGNLYLVVHSGSRHLGVEIAKFYQSAAYNQLNGEIGTLNSRADEVNALIARLKSEGRHKDIEKEVRELKGTFKTSVPRELAYVSGELMEDYLHDMVIAQKYAFWNRAAMVDEIIQGMGLQVVDQFQTIHNYIDTDNMILRKGAVSAQKGERLLIPINMREGSLLCVGKGNEDWNFSAPHGAGRLMSRTEAKKKFTVTEFEGSMQGIFSTSVNEDTLDECPMAYKNIDDIISNIGDTVEIREIIKPLYNFKASEK